MESVLLIPLQILGGIFNSKMKKHLQPFIPTLLATVIVGFITPAITLYYLVVGLPDPKYITHGPLFATPADDIMTFALGALFLLLVLTGVQIIFSILHSKKKIKTFFIGSLCITVQLFFIVIDSILLIITTD